MTNCEQLSVLSGTGGEPYPLRSVYRAVPAVSLVWSRSEVSGADETKLFLS